MQEGSLLSFTRQDIPMLGLMGLIGVAIPQSLTFVANDVAGPDIVAIMAPAAPVSLGSPVMGICHSALLVD